MKDLRVTLVQTPLAWEDRAANLARFDALLAGLRKGGTDLIILPEMFSTGFSMQAAFLAETMRGEAVAWMKGLARRKNAVVCGSLIIRDKGKFYNRLVWMPPSGKYATYDKRHLFGMAKEERTYTAGRRRLVVSLKGWRVCPLVCYDLRFPVWSRQDPKKPFDLLIYVANWPTRRSSAWRLLLAARAVENQCYVAGVNRTGADGNGVAHRGDSAVIDPSGERIRSGPAGRAFVETVVLSAKTLHTVRRYMPFLRDADRYTVHTT
jgi:predicted amidohydrolase